MNFANIYKKYGILTILIVFIIISALMNSTFIKPVNLTNILRQVVVVGIIACGAQLIMVAGMIDLSPGSVLALSGCIAADVMVKTNSPLLAIIVGLAIGTICGLISGLVIIKFAVPSFIMTLAMQAMARGAVYVYTNAVPISNLGSFTEIGQGYIGPIPISVIIFAVIIVITGLLLNKMRLGRYLYAVGGNMGAAKASGINDRRVRLYAFLYGGFAAGLAGIMLTARMNSGQPIAGVGYEFNAVTGVVIGGTSLNGGIGKLSGTIYGVLLIGVLNNIMNLQNVSSYFQQIVQGAIIAIAVIIDVKVRAATEK